VRARAVLAAVLMLLCYWTPAESGGVGGALLRQVKVTEFRPSHSQYTEIILVIDEPENIQLDDSGFRGAHEAFGHNEGGAIGVLGIVQLLFRAPGNDRVGRYLSHCVVLRGINKKVVGSYADISYLGGALAAVSYIEEQNEIIVWNESPTKLTFSTVRNARSL